VIRWTGSNGFPRLRLSVQHNNLNTNIDFIQLENLNGNRNT
jgi:hypothetical protein